MKLKQLGNSDMQITPLGVGAWAIGGDEWGRQNDDDRSRHFRSEHDHDYHDVRISAGRES